MRRGILGVALLSLTACGAPTPRLNPADLPLFVRDQVFTLQYRLDRQPTQVTAAGLISSSAQMFRFAELFLQGVAANDRVVSQSVTRVDGSFGQPVPFSIDLKPTGAEERFVLQVGAYALGWGGR